VAPRRAGRRSSRSSRLATTTSAPSSPERSPFGRDEILDGPLRLYVGLVDGLPVATAGACVAHGLIDVEWVSTMPGARRRGYGEALTWAATVADPSLPAALIASDLGQAIYERMGYVRLLRMSLWWRPPSG
jgi:hypothetical protein